jgi:CheY-like chemotaxis protein
MKILILDDMPERHDGFKKIFSGAPDELVHTWTYFEALEALEKAVLDGKPFGMACLDHDLGDNPDISADLQVGMYRDHVFTGADVCSFLVKNPRLCPPQVLIHSWNPSGSEIMRNILSRIPHIKVVVRPFST